jgi:hypothetical protein
VYYAIWIVAIVILYRAFPIIPEYMDAERARHIRTATGFLGPDDVDIPGFAVGPEALLQMSLVIPIAVSMAFAFGLSLPIAWMYTWTRRGKTYSRSLAQTIVIVPMAIALVVFLVKGSLPLAFSLAGIVAAVRFRSSLSEPIDAIYVLVAIGVGLAAGVQLLPVAAIGSWGFVAAVLLVQHLSLGADPPRLVGWQLLPAGMTGGSPHEDLQQGGENVDVRDIIVNIQATDGKAAHHSIEGLLDAYAKRWRCRNELSVNPQVLLYDVRLIKGVSAHELVTGLERFGAAYINKVEVSVRANEL